MTPVSCGTRDGVLAAVLALIPGLRATVTGRISDTTYDRQNLVQAGLNMIMARPLTGFGWGEFQNNSLLYFRQSQNYPLTRRERVRPPQFPAYLRCRARDSGRDVVGTGASDRSWVSALLTRGPPDLRFWRKALVAAVVRFAVVASTIPPIEFPNLSVWVLAGVAFSGRYAQSWKSYASDASAGHDPARARALGSTRRRPPQHQDKHWELWSMGSRGPTGGYRCTHIERSAPFSIRLGQLEACVLRST